MRVPQFLESALKPSFFKSCLLLSKSYCLQKYCFYIRGRPDRILLLQTPSLWPGYGTETKPTQFTASAGQNSSPAFSSRDLAGCFLPCPCTHRAAARSVPVGAAGHWPRLRAPAAARAASAGLSGSPGRALSPSPAGFCTAFTACKWHYKQLPRSHRDVIIPIKLKPILLPHPLYIGSFTKRILPLLYSKWTSWCTSSNSSYHLSS